MSWTEILGFVTGAVSVWLYARQHVWAWPIGIANSAFWLVLFWQSRLFLGAGLQVVYIAIALWGWYLWLHGGPGSGRLPVSRLRRREALLLAGAGVVATGLLWWAMVTQDDALPFWDAATTVLSLIAQYLLSRKVLANWWCWITVDVAFIGMYASQQLYLTAALQPLLIVLCVIGLRSWRASAAARPVPVEAAAA